MDAIRRDVRSPYLDVPDARPLRRRASFETDPDLVVIGPPPPTGPPPERPASAPPDPPVRLHRRRDELEGNRGWPDALGDVEAPSSAAWTTPPVVQLLMSSSTDASGRIKTPTLSESCAGTCAGEACVTPPDDLEDGTSTTAPAQRSECVTDPESTSVGASSLAQPTAEPRAAMATGDASVGEGTPASGPLHGPELHAAPLPPPGTERNASAASLLPRGPEVGVEDLSSDSSTSSPDASPAPSHAKPTQPFQPPLSPLPHVLEAHALPSQPPPAVPSAAAEGSMPAPQVPSTPAGVSLSSAVVKTQPEGPLGLRAAAQGTGLGPTTRASEPKLGRMRSYRHMTKKAGGKGAQSKYMATRRVRVGGPAVYQYKGEMRVVVDKKTLDAGPLMSGFGVVLPLPSMPSRTHAFQDKYKADFVPPVGRKERDRVRAREAKERAEAALRAHRRSENLSYHQEVHPL
ncbi:hypothetical protein JCM3770_007482 [Rhodotorula araucariae]